MTARLKQSSPSSLPPVPRSDPRRVGCRSWAAARGFGMAHAALQPTRVPLHPPARALGLRAASQHCSLLLCQQPQSKQEGPPSPVSLCPVLWFPGRRLLLLHRSTLHEVQKQMHLSQREPCILGGSASEQQTGAGHAFPGDYGMSWVALCQPHTR